MERQIKDFNETETGFKVVQNGNKIESVNKMGKVFHSIDISYASKGVFYHGWIGYRSNEQIKEVLEGHFMDLFLKHRCRKMLINNKEMTGTFSAINDWLVSEFMPKMLQKGLTHNAVVLPGNLFAQLAVEDWDQKIGTFHNRNFKSNEEAIKWLEAV